MTSAEGPQRDPSLASVLTEVLTEVQQLRQEVREGRDEIQKSREQFQHELQLSRQQLQQEVDRWDERFFQLSRDTLGFTRTVVTVAAVVAVLIPLLKDVAPLVIEILRNSP